MTLYHLSAEVDVEAETIEQALESVADHLFDTALEWRYGPDEDDPIRSRGFGNHQIEIKPKASGGHVTDGQIG